MAGTSSKRVGLSKKTRFDVFKRDGFKCMYCGAHPPSVLLHVDHVVPVAAGGKNDLDNLITACEPCNLGKGARDLNNVPQAWSDRAAEIQERERQIAGYEAAMSARRERLEEQAWLIAEMWMDANVKDSIRKDWLVSIRMFIEKLGYFACEEAMSLATARKRGQDASFKYFCGICWSKIREAYQ